MMYFVFFVGVVVGLILNPILSGMMQGKKING
jgi:hypothetical protein